MTTKVAAMNPVSAYISAIYSTPIDCPGCGEHAHLTRREGFGIGTERRAFECVSCRQKNGHRRSHLGPPFDAVASVKEAASVGGLFNSSEAFHDAYWHLTDMRRLGINVCFR